jgi:hypothetical protein
MTPRQQEAARNKIKKIKAALAADKKRWGGFYDDSGGMRYMPPALYIKLEDYTGGLRYMNWFHKNFPDDIGYPKFLFEHMIILFKTGRRKEAEQKAFACFTENTYVFDQFFGRELVQEDNYEWSNMATMDYAANYFTYSHKLPALADVADWLQQFILSDRFLQAKTTWLAINRQLKHEDDTELRGQLREQASALVAAF